MSGQMQWRRDDSNECHLWIKDPEALGFVPYRQSKIATSDGAGFSPGYTTFCKGLKLGYEVLKNQG